MLRGRAAESNLGLDFPRPMARAVVHLDARYLGLADGASVSSWPVRPGSNISATAGSAPTYRATGLSSRPSVEFALGNYLDLGAAGRALVNNATGITIFAVGSCSGGTDATQTAVHFSRNDSSGSSRAGLRMRVSGSRALRGSARRVDSDSETQTASVGATDTACICSVVIDYVGGTMIAGVNGVFSASASLPGSSSGNSQSSDAAAAVIGAGSSTATANRFEGFLSFVAVFPMVVSAQRQLRVRQYLGRSFGITTV